jgi:hypothetical protein
MIEGSGRPKNMWIRWIRIRIRMRNTALSCVCLFSHQKLHILSVVAFVYVVVPVVQG